MANSMKLYLWIIGSVVEFIENCFFFLEKSDAVGPSRFCEKFDLPHQSKMDGND